MMAPVNSLLDKIEENSQTLEIPEIKTIVQVKERSEINQPVKITDGTEKLKLTQNAKILDKSPDTIDPPKIPKNPDVTETLPPTTKAEPTEPSKKSKITASPEAPKPTQTIKTPKTSHPAKSTEAHKTPENQESPSLSIELAAQDVRRVIDQQKEQNQTLTTKLNILFVTNGALFTSLTISRLLFVPGFFSLAELLGFLLTFTLLINAFLPRQLAVSPNLGDKKFLERYLVLSPQEYQLQMIVNLVETYNANKQRLEDVSSSLQYSAYVTWSLALLITLHVVAVYFVPAIDLSSFG